MPSQKEVPLAFMGERWIGVPEWAATTPKAPREGGVAGSLGLAAAEEEEEGAAEEEAGEEAGCWGRAAAAPTRGRTERSFILFGVIEV